MESLRIQIIIGSTRDGRFCDKPARWVHQQAQKMEGVEAELIDLRDHPLPFFDRPLSPSMSKPGDYGSPIADAWASIVSRADAYVLVSPEYNHGTSGVLKNALDTVYYEWNNKAVGFVSYGSVGGARAVEQLRLVAVELQMAPMSKAVHIPGDIHFPILFGKAEWNAEVEDKLRGQAEAMLSQLVWWGRALKAARAGS